MTDVAAVSDEIADWPDRLEAACVGTRFRPELVRVLATCASTQDLARELGPGAIVATGRQTAGRGRLGRAWADDRGCGIAVSIVVPAADAARLSLAAGLAMLEVVAGLVTDPAAARLGLKFPNDLVDRVSGRKVGGVLVESDAAAAVVGIGINVQARPWPADLPAIAVAELGVETPPDRIAVLERLPPRLDRLLGRSPGDLAGRFEAVHAPAGCRVEVESPDGTVSGTLRRLDPLGVLEVEDDRGVVHRTMAARSRIVTWKPGSMAT